ncbi:MAG: DUF4157 domain-containing protein [Gammaproteobacteria bacterium]
MARGPGIPLSPLVKARLAACFPRADLDGVRLHDGIPRYVPGRPAGYVNCDRIHVACRPERDDDPEWLALLAHEVTHVLQYRRLGAWRFRWAYLKEYLAGRLRGLCHEAAYRRISFEQAAREMEERLRRGSSPG